MTVNGLMSDVTGESHLKHTAIEWLITWKAEGLYVAILLLQDLVPDDNEGECKSTAEEHHHHAEKTPLVFNGEWQVLSKDKNWDQWLVRQDNMQHVM